MHISEGVIDIRICLGGYAVMAGLAAWSMKKTQQEDIPKIAIMGAVFFVSSLIHIKIGITSIHPTLVGLTGIILGPHAPLAILAGLLFQAVMFGHGGISTLGLNMVLFTIPAIVTWYGLRLFRRVAGANRFVISIAGGVLSGVAVSGAAAIVAGIVFFSANELAALAAAFSVANITLSVLEGIFTGIALHAILRIKPDMIETR
jgi:cobalt/nickel transport system permease protein